MEKNQLPKLPELHYDVQEAFKNDQLNLLLNQPPHASWLKKHPMTDGMYLPIDKVEFLLTRIFQEWWPEVLQVQSLFNSVQVTIRLHYKNPLTGEWKSTDGVGAAPVQTDAGKSAADLGAIKTSAIQIAVPSAKSYAVKDAAENLGTLFGKDLNRKDTLMFAGAYNDTANAAPVQLTQADIHAANANYQSPKIMAATPVVNGVAQQFQTIAPEYVNGHLKKAANGIANGAATANGIYSNNPFNPSLL